MGDNCSDVELRRRLREEFNFICGPVTDTTRSIYLKKLDNFIKERNKETNARRLKHDSNDANGNSSFLSPVRSSPRNSARRTDFENGRLTPEIAESGRKSRASPNRSPKKSRRTEAAAETSISPRRRTATTLSTYSSEESGDEEPEGNSSVLYNYMTSRKSKPQLRSTPTKVPLPRINPTPLRSTPATPTRKSTRGKLSPPITATSFLANFSDSEPENDAQNERSSTESIRDRLLKHRRPAKKFEAYRNSNHSVVTQASEADEANFYSAKGSSSSSNLVSFTILCLVIAFFIFILSLYVYSRFSFASFGKGDPLQLELDVNSGSRGTHAPICEEKITSTTSKCFHSSNNVTAALFIVKSIQNFIQEYSYQYLCESNGGKVTKEDPFSFSLPELRTHVLLQKEKFCKFTDVCGDDEHSDEVVLKSLGYALDLIKLNPQWNIIVDEESDKDYFLRIDPDTYQLSLPFYCRMQLYLTKTMKHLILSMIVIAVVWAVFTYVHRKRKQAAEIQEQIIDLVEKSLDLLQSPDNPQSMPVIHIRDMLFTTQERQSAKCMKIWSKVVSFIEENESRVKVGIEKIDGEDYKTWKWIATSKGNTSLDEGKSTTMKTGTIEWQGQAFCDERPSEGQNNTHVVVNENAMLNSTKKATPNSQQSNTFFAPTCFLKVRNMFTAETQMDPNWKVNIENAILEKCSANSLSGKHGVLHICVEDQDSEGIVYIKCDSRDSATVAFHALHGWWCERKLVSVKFLKEERYYSRFPEARCFNEPLQIRNIYR